MRTGPSAALRQQAQLQVAAQIKVDEGSQQQVCKEGEGKGAQHNLRIAMVHSRQYGSYQAGGVTQCAEL